MDINDPPRVLISEIDDASAALGKSLFSSLGCDTVLEPRADRALSLLAESADDPFAIFACGFSVNTTNGPAAGPDILSAAMEKSPLTRRMLWLPGDEPGHLVKAINSAGIHACVTYPLEAEELTVQAENCMESFFQALKHRQFVRVMTDHNRKMYRMARNLKKKDGQRKQLIEERRAQLKALNRECRELENAGALPDSVTLARVLEYLSCPADPGLWTRLFNLLCADLESRMNALAGKHGVEWTAPGPEEIIAGAKGDSELPPGAAVLVQAVYISLLDRYDRAALSPEGDEEPEQQGGGEDASKIRSASLASPVEITVSDDRTRAVLWKNTDTDLAPDFAIVQELILEKEICFGLTPEEEIRAWLGRPEPDDEPFVVARAKPPTPPEDGSVAHFFQTDYTNPGRVREDGSIDFRDRGEVPMVNEGDLLARKSPARPGKPGIDVFGNEIPAPDPYDPPFGCGAGAVLDRDTLEIRAKIYGQPHVDPMGTITVNPEFVVKGDVDFETGNISFDGNIVVRGCIRPGFTVKGINLTANEIEGATIVLSGELNVSTGITDSTIKTVGNIHTKFIHNSKIFGFGDFTVHKEIIDATILLSGRCLVPGGHVIASKIAAKQGIEAGTIGTVSSEPARLRIGVEDHIEALIILNARAAQGLAGQIQEAEKELGSLEKEHTRLESQSAEQAYVQDICLQRIRELKTQHLGIKDLSRVTERREIAASIKENLKTAKQAAKELEEIFSRQESLSDELNRVRRRLAPVEKSLAALAAEKKSLEAYRRRFDPDPVLDVNRLIRQDSRVQGPNTSLVMHEDKHRCRIREVRKKERGRSWFEMQVSGLES